MKLKQLERFFLLYEKSKTIIAFSFSCSSSNTDRFKVFMSLKDTFKIVSVNAFPQRLIIVIICKPFLLIHGLSSHRSIDPHSQQPGSQSWEKIELNNSAEKVFFIPAFILQLQQISNLVGARNNILHSQFCGAVPSLCMYIVATRLQGNMQLASVYHPR